MRPTHALAALVALAGPVLGATASITSVIPNRAHQCIELCAWNNYQGNVPLALGCDDPYENECYCPTATESVSKASVAIQRCISSRCAAGDYTRDLSSLRSIYAGYCKDAGYTQDAALLGYTVGTADPKPSTTTSSSSSSSSSAVTGEKTDSSSQPSKTATGGASTTTQRTTVTQTRASGADGSGSPDGTVVVVQETETVFVDGARRGSGPSMAIKIGVGVAVPVVVLLALAGVGFLIWRKRRAAASRKRALADSAVVEAHGGGVGQDQGSTEKDVGAIKTGETLTGTELASKKGAIVYGLQEVQGSNRSDSYEVHGEHTARAQQVHGSHRPSPYEAHGSYASDSHEVPGDRVAAAQEVQGSHRPNIYEAHGSYRSDSHEVPGDHTARIHEAHGNHARPELPDQAVNANAAAELPGSNGPAGWIGGDRAV